ncbi:MAG: divergent polysaccharide deacetylase family protein [Elusimicrobiota bacterium]|nr:divergent polysaccharide deacetylase family protein [Elusimicrobiota bacterium]
MHLLLEPKNMEKNYPGKVALLLNMSDEQIAKKFSENLNSLGIFPVGVNNHMGSAFTEHEEKMKVLLECIKKHNLFFLDPRTSNKSVARKVAKSVDVKCLTNNVFLDMVGEDKEKIKKQFDILLNIAKKHGYGIGLGHVNRKTLPEVLKLIVSEYKQNNVEFVYLNDL